MKLYIDIFIFPSQKKLVMSIIISIYRSLTVSVKLKKFNSRKLNTDSIGNLFKLPLDHF